MAGVVKVGPWGAKSGKPRYISSCSNPRRLESITICSAECPGGRIYSFSFVYVDQQGEAITVGPWGTGIMGCQQTIEMNPGEHLNHVSGTADTNGVTSLKLASNQSEYGPYGCPSGTEFSMPLQQGKGEVVSFFGLSGDTLKALGVYVPGNEAVKIGPWGGYGGAPRDVRMGNKPVVLKSITVQSTESGGGRVYGLSFVYDDQNGQSVRIGPWGSTSKGKANPISMNDGEYVKLITGTTDNYGVTSLKFETNAAKYGPYGAPSGTAFSVPLPDNGTNDGSDNGAAVAFFGRSGDTLVAFGAYIGLAPKD